MKENTINYSGIKTNNLKDISLEIPKGCLWGIAGPSGSGKSSLAYGTIYAISQYEWEKISNNAVGNISNFRIDTYEHVIPAIALKQENLNENPRSTIATFLRLDKDLRLLFASANKVTPGIFSFNNPRNACPYCDGLGTESHLEKSQMIDWNKSISEKPFLPWQKNYNQKVLEKYAQSLTIPLDVKLKDLSDKQVELLLYSKSSEKYRVTYVLSGKKRTREFHYIGLMLEMQNLKQDKQHISSHQKIAEYTYSRICSHCKGSRFSDNVLQYTYNGKSIGDLYLLELSELAIFLKKSIQTEPEKEYRKLLNNVHRVILGLIDGKLEYLNLNRSIPSLSGGELQRLRLVNMLISQISGMLYIIDEPSARLHISEYDSIINGIRNLRERGNTILMIEHNPYFLKQADKILMIGPGSGEEGGQLIRYTQEAVSFAHVPTKCTDFFSFNHITENNLHDISVNIPIKGITGIYGPSGSGKSTLVRCIEKMYKGSEYISQKPLRGSIASTIASYCGVLDDIRNVYSQHTGEDRDFFSFASEKGQCPVCKGKGRVKYTLDFGKTEVEVICDECKGRRFNEDALAFKYKGYSIYDLLSLTIDHIIEQCIFLDYAGIIKKLHLLQKLGLGYLNLFRTTDTLSGGEAQRLKLTKFIGKKLKNKLFIFDEPLIGLSCKDAYNVLSIFQEITKNEGSVIFIEHNILGFSVCDYVLEMGPGKGKFGGNIMFAGDIISFKKTNNYTYYMTYKGHNLLDNE